MEIIVFGIGNSGDDGSILHNKPTGEHPPPNPHPKRKQTRNAMTQSINKPTGRRTPRPAPVKGPPDKRKNTLLSLTRQSSRAVKGLPRAVITPINTLLDTIRKPEAIWKVSTYGLRGKTKMPLSIHGGLWREIANNVWILFLFFLLMRITSACSVSSVDNDCLMVRMTWLYARRSTYKNRYTNKHSLGLCLSVCL